MSCHNRLLAVDEFLYVLEGAHALCKISDSRAFCEHTKDRATTVACQRGADR